MADNSAEPKKKLIFKSKTFWFNVLSVAGLAVGIVPLPPLVAEATVGIVNVLLRIVTKEPVSVTGK